MFQLSVPHCSRVADTVERKSDRYFLITFSCAKQYEPHVALLIQSFQSTFMVLVPCSEVLSPPTPSRREQHSFPSDVEICGARVSPWREVPHLRIPGLER